ncbi:MAG: hypothetical protein KAQ69_13320 [Spirochaetales bacterium]|nr:hypothetical protein [Spirochaetales bacterium]
MSLFRNNPYKLQKKIPQPFKHEIASWEEGICVLCGNKMEGTTYYCPICEKYYCIDCAVNNIGAKNVSAMYGTDFSANGKSNLIAETTVETCTSRPLSRRGRGRLRLTGGIPCPGERLRLINAGRVAMSP